MEESPRNIWAEDQGLAGARTLDCVIAELVTKMTVFLFECFITQSLQVHSQVYYIKLKTPLYTFLLPLYRHCSSYIVNIS